LFVRVSRFLDEEALSTCNESILLADEDGNGELDSSDFTTLVEVLTGGAISAGTIAELPLRLRTVYYLTACMCVLQPGAANDCCVGVNSAISVDALAGESPSMVNRVFCGEVVRGIAYVKEDLNLTPSPSTFPMTPTSAPSDPSMVLPTVSPSPGELICTSLL